MLRSPTRRITGQRRCFWLAAAALAAFLACGWGCTDAELQPIPPERPYRDDKLALAGSYCTLSPESRLLPLRVLFVVDSSESMLVTDPGDPVTGETGRERAVTDTWERLLEGGPEGVRIGIMRFSAEASSQTTVDVDGDGVPDRYFTTDTDQLSNATLILRQTDRTTNYLNALSEAYFELRTEMLEADLESLPLSKYLVVFVSDGLPDTDSRDARENSESNILDAVVALNDLAQLFHVGTFEFHTAYLSAGEGPARDRAAQELLQRMAEVGGGNFRSFPSGESLNFLFVDFSAIRRVFTLRGLSAVNLNTVVDDDQIAEFLDAVALDGGLDGGQDAAALDAQASSDAGTSPPGAAGDAGTETGDAAASDASAPDADADGGESGPPGIGRQFTDIDGNEIPGCGERLVDTDGDGLADLQEVELNTDPLIMDTDDDGLNDRLEWQLAASGLDPLNPDDAECTLPKPCIDQNADGLCDCLMDSDLDGICDCVSDPEQRCHDEDRGLDCQDRDADGICDCPDFDADEKCDYDDRDGDGLNDCEEMFSGTAQNGNDTDADGLPDGLEVRMQSNPAEADRRDDVDWDQADNGIEVQAGTDPWCDDSAIRSYVSYRYDVDTTGLDEGTTCYDFEIGNITLVPTARNRAAAYPGNGWNRVVLYAGEVSFDDPESFASYRIACVMARYEPDGNFKNPPSGRVKLSTKDFVDVDEFDEDQHCKWP